MQKSESFMDNLRGQNSSKLFAFDVVFIQQIAHCHCYCQNPHEDLGIIIPLKSKEIMESPMESDPKSV